MQMFVEELPALLRYQKNDNNFYVYWVLLGRFQSFESLQNVHNLLVLRYYDADAAYGVDKEMDFPVFFVHQF